MAVVFLIILGIGAVFALCLVGAPTLDLVQRNNAVPPWYALPALAALPVLLFVPLLLLTEPFAWGTIETIAAVVMGFHVATAGLLALLAGGLAVARGLRPGGPTARRQRTSLVALGVLVVLGVQPVGWVLIDEEVGFFLGWLVPVGLLGVAWVLALNRRGPYRLTEGKRWSAALLLSAQLHFWAAGALLIWSVQRSNPQDLQSGAQVLLAVVAVTMAGLAGGLRYLAGPLPHAPLVASWVSMGTLLVPPLLLTLWHPLEAGHSVPAWVDLRGVPGPPLRLERYLECVDDPNQGPSDCRNPWSVHYAAPDPATPLDRIRSGADVLVGDGRRKVDGEWAFGDAVVLHEQSGLARIGNGAQLFPLGPELHDALDRLAEVRAPLEVERSPRWTAQDFVSICASYRWSCRLQP